MNKMGMYLIGILLIVGIVYAAIQIGQGSQITFAKYEGGQMFINYQNGKSEVFTGTAKTWYTKQNNVLKTVDPIKTEILSDLWEYNKRFGVPFPEAEFINQ